MYVCGPTVYDFAHIGNARAYVVFDLLYRLLKAQYSKVTYVRNITDVDDKINAAIAKTGEDITSLTQRTTKAYHEDMASLQVLSPDIEPRATAHIPEMIAMILQLLDQGYAYEADGHVLFAVSTDANYGNLSGRNREEMVAGARVEVAPYKRDPADFVLWKPSDAATPGWDSPWGRGRPGWHIECSAMCRKYLGDTFDIHGGGIDLIFPHHENEVAQSCCALQVPLLARFFVHNGHLTVSGDKMAKSVGNFFTVRDLLETYPGEAIRLALLSTQYRQPLNWDHSLIQNAKQTLDRFYGCLRGLDKRSSTTPDSHVLAALNDDLNTPLALMHLHELATSFNKATQADERLQIAETLRESGKILGILQQPAEDWFHGSPQKTSLADTDIEKLLQQRQQARDKRQFDESDRLRDHLLDQGIILEDSPSGTTWRRL